MTKNICSFFTLINKEGNSETDYRVEEWDGTSHGDRNKLDKNLHQIMWAGYLQDDWQTNLDDGYINIERGIFEWTPGEEMPWSILWLRDATDIEATKAALLEKVGFDDTNKVNWRVNLIDHRIETDNPTFYTWWYIDNDGVTHKDYTKHSKTTATETATGADPTTTTE